MSCTGAFWENDVNNEKFPNQVHESEHRNKYLMMILGVVHIEMPHRIQTVSKEIVNESAHGGSLHMASFYRTTWKMFLIRNKILNKWLKIVWFAFER